MSERRSLLKFILATFISFGIYPVVFFSTVGEDVNIIAEDGKKTMNFLIIALSLIVFLLVWFLYLMPLFLTSIVAAGVINSADGLTTIGNIINLISLISSIFIFVWMHRMSNRIGKELERRGLDYKFNAKHYWLLSVLGAITLIAPLVYIHKLCKAMNMLAREFNSAN